MRGADRGEPGRVRGRGTDGWEWRTLRLVVARYGLWTLGALGFSALDGPASGIALAVMAVAAAFHPSPQHEAIHDHPTSRAALNEFLVSVPPALYRSRRDHVLKVTGHDRFEGHGEIVRRFAFRVRQPVAHPFARAPAGRGREPAG